MRIVYCMLLAVVVSAQLRAQSLLNTSWRADSTFTHVISSSAGHIDSLKIFFNSGNSFSMNAYDTTHDSVSYGIWWQITDSTFGWKDTANRAYAFATVCHGYDTAIIQYKTHDSTLSITHTNDQCGVRGTVLIGSNWIGHDLTSAVKSIKTTNFTISPNPFYDAIHIGFNGTKPNYFQLCDVRGKVLKSGMINSGNSLFTINGLEDMPKGIYYLQLMSEKDVSYFKMVKL